LAGYNRQSAADIVPTAVVRSGPVNNEFNALRDAFIVATGHKHDGTATEGAYIPLIGDSDAKNKVSIDTNNNRVGVFVEVSTVSTEQIRVQDGAIVPVTDDDIDLGTGSLEFKNLYLDGTATIDSLVADTADINGGTIDAVVIGSASAQAITGTLITATTGFSGPITGAVTGNVTGNLTGNVTGNVTGNLTGNVTASSGTSTFNNVTIAGTLDMDGATSATIINLASPTNTGDAATKGYVDTADALKLNLSGGTMSGAIAMGTNKITGLGTPTSTADAATKGYVDTQVSNLIDSAPGALDTLNELAAALGDDANFSTTVTNSLAGKLNLSGGTMTGAIAMGTNKITGMGDPTSNQDAATKVYVDTQRDTRLALTGGTMSGAIAMGTSKITGLGDPTSTQDAATKNYVDTQDATKLSLSGGTMTGAIAMGTNRITGMGDPVGNQDAATKYYIDNLFGSTTSAAASAAAAAVSASNAANSEANALTYSNNASNSASAAATSASNAAISYENFDDRYLGSKSSPPSTDNGGGALITGALYWNSAGNQLYVWDGSAWDQAAFNISGGLTTSDIGVTVQAYDAGLQSISGLTTAADKMIYTTAADTYAVTDLTAAGRAILDDADAAAQRTTLGLTALATTIPGTGITTFLATPSSANLAAAVTDETGSGALVFAASPTFTGTVTTAAIAMADNLLTRSVLKDYAIEGSAVGNTGATETFDLTNANFFSATLDQASTFTFSNPPASGDFGTFVLELTNGGAFAITWPASVDWPGGTAPTLTAAGKDQLVFTTRDGGTTWFGFVAGLDIKSP
jgi:hypothetical protein